MKKLLVAFAVAAFAVTAFTQDQPKPAAEACKKCDKAKQGECKGEKKCDKKAECKQADCPKAKKA